MGLRNLLICMSLLVVLKSISFSDNIYSYDTTSTTPPSTPVEFSGSISNQYQGRFHGNQADHDFSQSIYLNVDGLFDGKLSGALALRFYENLDNYSVYSRNTTYYTYEGISDSYSQRNRGQLYYGYVDVKDVLGPTKLRLGRQYIYQLEFAHFDGASFQWENLGDFDLELFGGKPVSYYSSTEGNITYGSSLDWHPWRFGSFGVAYMNYSDDSHHDDYLGFNAKQYIGNSHNIELLENYTFLNSRSRDLQLQGVYTVPSVGLSINATYYRQIDTLRDFSDQYSAYYQAIGDYYPFYMMSIGAYKELGDHLTINAGYTLRALNNIDDESQYNRQYNMFFGGFAIRNIVLKDLDFSVSLQRWETESYTASSTKTNNANPGATDNTLPNEETIYYNVPGDHTNTISAELAYRWNKKNRIQIGSDFQKYKYNYEYNQEDQNVRTIYIKLRWQVNDKWQWYSRMEQEDQSNDPSTYYKVITSLTYSF